MLLLIFTLSIISFMIATFVSWFSVVAENTSDVDRAKERAPILFIKVFFGTFFFPVTMIMILSWSFGEETPE